MKLLDIVAVIFVIAIGMLILFAINTSTPVPQVYTPQITTPQETVPAENRPAQQQNPAEQEQAPTGKVFYEDNYLKAAFVDIIETDYLPGVGYIRVVFENKSNQEITVFPENSSVNDTMVQYLGGTYATMQGGKNLNYSWGFDFQLAGITSIDEVKTLEFSLWIVDENTETLAKSDMITVNVR